MCHLLDEQVGHGYLCMRFHHFQYLQKTIDKHRHETVSDVPLGVTGGCNFRTLLLWWGQILQRICLGMTPFLVTWYD